MQKLSLDIPSNDHLRFFMNNKSPFKNIRQEKLSILIKQFIVLQYPSHTCIHKPLLKQAMTVFEPIFGTKEIQSISDTQALDLIQQMLKIIIISCDNHNTHTINSLQKDIYELLVTTL